MGTFTFKWEHPATEVYVTGTFDDWKKSVKLDKEGDIFQKTVELPITNTKILYKFVVDTNWTTSPTHAIEIDEHNNANNVLLPEEIKPTAAAAVLSSAAPGSSTAAMAAQQPLEKGAASSALPGTFPETPAGEPSDFTVKPIPASEGPGNPIQLAPGAAVPGFNSSDVTKGVHDDPELKANDQTFGVAPLPATGGIGNPIHLAPGEKVPPPSDITANTTTSNVKLDKESYEKADGGAPVKPPAAAGAAGSGSDPFSLPPITGGMIPESSLPIGNGAPPATKDSGAFVSSAAPTSTTAALAGQVPLESGGVPSVVKESQQEAHASPEASAVPEAVEEKKEVEQELLKKVPTEPPTSGGNITDHAAAAAGAAGATLAAAGAAATAYAVSAKDKAATQLSSAAGVTPQSTTAGLAGKVPKEPSGVPTVVSESISAAHTSPEAAANPVAVAEKKDFEKELLSEVKKTNASGEPAPATTAALSAKAPGDGLSSNSLVDPEPLKSSSETSGINKAKDSPIAQKLSTKPHEDSRDVSPHSGGHAPATSAAAAAIAEPSTPVKKTDAASSSAATPAASSSVADTPASKASTDTKEAKKSKRKSMLLRVKSIFKHKDEK